MAQTFQLKNRRFFVSLNAIYTPTPSMLKKISLSQMFAKKYFWQHWTPATWRVAIHIQLKNTFFCWLIAI